MPCFLSCANKKKMMQTVTQDSALKMFAEKISQYPQRVVIFLAYFVIFRKYLQCLISPPVYLKLMLFQKTSVATGLAHIWQIYDKRRVNICLTVFF